VAFKKKAAPEKSEGKNKAPARPEPPSETIGGSSGGSGPRFGSKSPARLSKNSDNNAGFPFGVTVRDNSPGAMPEGVSAVIHGGPDDKQPHPEAQTDPRENKNV
jgi:hypothetical protein